MLQSALDSLNDNSTTLLWDVDTYALLKVSQDFRTMIIVGQLNLTLPSWEESNRLCSEIFRNVYVYVVPEEVVEFYIIVEGGVSGSEHVRKQ